MLQPECDSSVKEVASFSHTGREYSSAQSSTCSDCSAVSLDMLGGSCVTIAVGGAVSLGGMTLVGEVTLSDGDGVTLSADAAGSALGEGGVAGLAHESAHESMHLEGPRRLSSITSS
jgi:hypothetical protein